MRQRTGWGLLLGAVVLCYWVLSFYQTTTAAAPATGGPPFANAVEQRMEGNVLLKEIRDLLKEQNVLLRSGELRVVITVPKKPQ